MDAKLNLSTAPIRDPRYAPRRLDIEDRGGGEMVLTNPMVFSTEHQTTTSCLAHWAKAAPDRIWLAERSGQGWRTLTFGEAWQRIAALAGGLHELGIVGERPLLILARNGVEHALISYAAMGQGMPVAPMSPQYGLAGANITRLTAACEVLKPAAVFTEDAALFAEGLAAPILAGLPVIAQANPRPGDIPLERLYRAAGVQPVATPDQHAKYLLTSGSTGLPKAVICEHYGMSINAAQNAACFDDPEPPILVNAAPWSHGLGANSVLHVSAHRGGSLYIDAGQPMAGKFGETLRNLREIKPTFQSMVPAGWMLLAEELEKDEGLARDFFERVRILQYGGAALGQATADRIEAVAIRTVGEQINFGTGYGATETGPTASNIHWPNTRVGVIGLPLPGTSVRLVPQDGKLEFRVKGPQVSPGYLGQPELSAASRDEEGFYRLGDAVRFADPADPSKGMMFDGRLAENFKLASGTFVIAGNLRIAVVGAIGDAVTDAVICGEGQPGVGLLLYPNPAMGRAEVQAAVQAGIAGFNGKAKGAASRVARALVLAGPPDAASGEITDKGYIAQSLARDRHAGAIERLFAEPPDADIIAFD
jgi:feruloyl-CoA synthase